jgi:hypothetical protein
LLLFVLYCAVLRYSFALVGLGFKASSPARGRSFFATAELKLFSTVLRGGAIDLFFDSGTAAGGMRAVRQPESGVVARLKFLQSWRECGFRVAPLYVA